MLRTLDRYLFRQVMGPLWFGVATFTTLFVGSDLVNIASAVVSDGAPVGAAAHLLLLKLPQIIVWTFPMSVLMGTLLALSRLSSTSELVAMRAGGVSFFRLMAPVLALSALIAATSIGLGEAVVPWANQESQRVMAEEIQGGKLPRVTKNVMLRDFSAGRLSRLVYATDFDQETATMRNVAMLEWRDGEPFRQTTADRLVWEKDGWYFVGGKTYLFAGPEGKGQVTEFSFRNGKQRAVLNERPEDIPRTQKSPDAMTLAELRSQIALLRRNHESAPEYALQYWLKFATPFSSMVFAFIGTPLGIQHHRRATSVGFGLSIVIIFAYYVLMTLFNTLGRGGVMAPVLAAWAPDVLLLLAGVWFVARARK